MLDVQCHMGCERRNEKVTCQPVATRALLLQARAFLYVSVSCWRTEKLLLSVDLIPVVMLYLSIELVWRLLTPRILLECYRRSVIQIMVPCDTSHSWVESWDQSDIRLLEYLIDDRNMDIGGGCITAEKVAGQLHACQNNHINLVFLFELTTKHIS
jgi:hypothetical protein